MKKILSILLCAVMLVSTFAITSFAADAVVDQAVLFDDLNTPGVETGNAFYVANEHEFTKSWKGYTMAFDFMPLYGTSCEGHTFNLPTLKHLSQFSVYASGLGVAGLDKVVGYNFEEGAYVIARQNGWPPNGFDTAEGSTGQSYFIDYEKEMPITYGEWHRIAFRFEENYLDFYIDGELVQAIEFTESGHAALLIMSQHCSYLMDNVVFATNDYDLENEDLDAEIAEGNVYGHTDFNSVDTLIADVEEGQTYDFAEYGGLNFNNAKGYSLVERDTYAGTLPDSDDEAALSFADTTGKAGKTSSADLTYNGGAFEATKLQLITDPYLTYNSVEGVADGCEVTVNDGYVDIKVTDAFKGGKVATFKFDVAAEGPAQNSLFRYGLKVTADSTAPADLVLDAGTLTAVNFKLGDANDDGRVTAADVIVILRFRAKYEGDQLGIFVEEAADVDKSGFVNSRDTIYILRWLAKWPGYEL